MPYGEEITINVGDAVRIHPNYKNYKFKKLKFGITYFVKEVEWDKIRYLETEQGGTILLNMDKRYFEHAGKEEQMEDDEDFQPDYALEVGDIVLIQNSGFGFVGKDKNKYVEVTGHGDYFGGEGVRVRPYDCQLETVSCGDKGVVGYGSFGKSPMILLNIYDDHVTDEEHTVVAEGSKQEVDKALGINREQYTGSSSDYYKVYVKNPTTLEAPYEAECNDIIESLKMTFAEGNAFKAIWRKAKARQGVKKKGYDNGVYDSEKVVFFGERMLIEASDGD
ncbi:nucleotide kinase [Pseudomonas phage vB_PsaM_M1]|nr:nucleotide kinase [Pseudomonas phage vB_PsaM_M1]